MKSYDISPLQTKNLYFIGRNYLDHIKELKNTKPNQPVLFTKSLSTLCWQKEKISFSSNYEDIHYEVELVLRVNQDVEKVTKQEALSYIGEIGLGIDFTNRAEQAKEKEQQIPWMRGKNQRNFSYVGNFYPFPTEEVEFSLVKNDTTVQLGNSKRMLFNFSEIISYISSLVPLNKGDLLFTGTPEGVGPVSKGDTLEGFLNNQKAFRILVE